MSEAVTPPETIEDDETAALYAYLWRNGPTCPATVVEETRLTTGTLYNRVQTLKEQDLVEQPKDPRQPQRTMLVPSYGPHARTAEEWLAEVVYGDR